VRAIDETRGDYLYLAHVFVPIEPSEAARSALQLAC
jgi:hypothetical protein